MHSDCQPERPMILAVCRDVRDVERVIEHVRSMDLPATFASDSPEAQHRARASALFHSIVFLEEMESIFLVAKDVLVLREAVNSWLRGIGEACGIHPYLMEWIRWSEGGDTTQRIQDAVLLVNSYLDLVGPEVDRIVTCLRRESAFEDALLLAVAASRNVPVTVVRSDRGARLVDSPRYRTERSIAGKYRTLYLPLIVATWFRLGRLCQSILRARSTVASVRPHHRTIAFLVGQNARKHVSNALLVMAQTRTMQDIVPRGLCFEAPGAHRAFLKEGLESVELEGFVPVADFRKLLALRRKVVVLAQREGAGFRSLNTLSHKGVNIAPVLWPFVRLFLSRDLPVRMVFQAAIRGYLEREQPLALRTWGENILELGLIAHEVIHDPEQYRRSTRIVMFDYPVGIMAPNPYFDCVRIPDRVFVSGILDKAMYAEANAPEANVVVTGFGRATELAEFRNATTRELSRRRLGLSNPPRYSIFYVPSGIVRGYMSAQEHVLVAATLVDLVNRRADCELLIKPHPTESMTSWYALLRELGEKGTAVKLIDRTLSPLDCVNAADIVVTKFSTVALEAMELDRPVISLALDGERAFQKIFENSIDAFTDRRSFETFLEGLMDDPERFTAWMRDRLRLQREYLPKKMHRPEGTVEAEIVRTLMASI